MDAVRLGLALRALRRRRGWTQGQLAAASEVSRALVSKLETGGAGSMQLDTVVTIAGKLSARIDVRVGWHGEELDRLLDREHALLADEMVSRLRALVWETIVEATYQVGSERGSIDILAYHPPTGMVLVIEVKSVVPDMQAMLSSLDRKVRHAPRIARERGWRPSAVAQVLVLPTDRTSRRRLAMFRATLDTRLPARTSEVLRWLARPREPVAGVLLLRAGPTSTPRVTRQRVRRRSGDATLGSPAGE